MAASKINNNLKRSVNDAAKDAADKGADMFLPVHPTHFGEYSNLHETFQAKDFGPAAGYYPPVPGLADILQELVFFDKGNFVQDGLRSAFAWRSANFFAKITKSLAEYEFYQNMPDNKFGASPSVVWPLGVWRIKVPGTSNIVSFVLMEVVEGKSMFHCFDAIAHSVTSSKAADISQMVTRCTELATLSGGVFYQWKAQYGFEWPDPSPGNVMPGKDGSLYLVDVDSLVPGTYADKEKVRKFAENKKGTFANLCKLFQGLHKVDTVAHFMLTFKPAARAGGMLKPGVNEVRKSKTIGGFEQSFAEAFKKGGAPSAASDDLMKTLYGERSSEPSWVRCKNKPFCEWIKKGRKKGADQVELAQQASSKKRSKSSADSGGDVDEQMEFSTVSSKRPKTQGNKGKKGESSSNVDMESVVSGRSKSTKQKVAMKKMTGIIPAPLSSAGAPQTMFGASSSSNSKAKATLGSVIGSGGAASFGSGQMGGSVGGGHQMVPVSAGNKSNMSMGLDPSTLFGGALPGVFGGKGTLLKMPAVMSGNANAVGGVLGTSGFVGGGASVPGQQRQVLAPATSSSSSAAQHKAKQSSSSAGSTTHTTTTHNSIVVNNNLIYNAADKDKESLAEFVGAVQSAAQELQNQCANFVGTVQTAAQKLQNQLQEPRQQLEN
mmetsp:Transcript_14487/g.36251  ORF Transcript_14487/g.36251 Transcript_14487/m.36251 type:complete len:661 (-) Transcript_14487:1500-3482(-)